MNTIRHKLHLQWKGKIEIAPRLFSTERYTYYVHITKYCEFAVVYLHWKYLDNDNVEVVLNRVLKLYSNTKGLYFNFSYWVSNFEKKTIRVYICE